MRDSINDLRKKIQLRLDEIISNMSEDELRYFEINIKNTNGDLCFKKINTYKEKC